MQRLFLRLPISGLATVAALLLGYGSNAGAGNVAEIVANPIPQYNGSTCQSYSAAILLALQNDPAFPINTLAALRDAEVGIRQRIEQSATTHNHIKDGKPEPLHDDIIEGVEDYTSGVYTLERKTLSGIDKLGDYIGVQTGVVTAPPFPIATSIVKTPLMVSVTSVGANHYAGHLVTVLGVSGPPSSERKYLIVNSAVKTGAGVKLFCDPAEPASQTTYGALTTWTSDIIFKDFGGSTYYVFSIVKK